MANIFETLYETGKVNNVKTIKKLFKIYFNNKMQKIKKYSDINENSIKSYEKNNAEPDCYNSLESTENDANERLCADYTREIKDDCNDYGLISIPVHFARTNHGTFFWAAANNLPADNDLNEPFYCYSSNQMASYQIQDRWAQA